MRRIKRWINIIVMLMLLLSTIALSPDSSRLVHAEPRSVTVWYVKTGASGTCTSWDDACPLVDAVNNAVPGSEIWVAAGTYKYAGGRESSLGLENGVALYGSYVGDEISRDQRDPDPATNSTILSGDISVIGKDSDNSYHVVIGSGTDSTAVIDGFTISGGEC